MENQSELNEKLINSAEFGNIGEVERLLKVGANVHTEDGGYVLFCAVKNGHTEIVKLLLKAGVNDTWALFWAVKYRHTEIVKLLIEARALYLIKKQKNNVKKRIKNSSQ